MSYFRVKDLPGFEGLVVCSDDDLTKQYIFVDVFFDTSDKTVIDLPRCAVGISNEYLEEVRFDDFALAEPADEPTKSPFGAYLYEGRFTKDTLEVVTVKYDNAVTVTIIEKNPPNAKGVDKTIYTQHFFAARESALELVEDVMHGQIDIDDLVFKMKELKEKELR